MLRRNSHVSALNRPAVRASTARSRSSGRKSISARPLVVVLCGETHLCRRDVEGDRARNRCLRLWKKREERRGVGEQVSRKVGEGVGEKVFLPEEPSTRRRTSVLGGIVKEVRRARRHRALGPPEGSPFLILLREGICAPRTPRRNGPSNRRERI